MKTKFFALIFFGLLTTQIFGQGSNPHDQKHELKRGTYVTCVDVMAEDYANGDSTALLKMILGIDQYELNYIAMYGLNKVIDKYPADNPKEAALRHILIKTRKTFPNLEIGVVLPQDTLFAKINESEFPYNPTSEYCVDNFVPLIKDMPPAILSSKMNPQPSSNPNHYYEAAVLRFATTVLWFFNGEFSINQTLGLQQNNTGLNSSGNATQNKLNNNSKESYFHPTPILRKDYFDWFSLEHEYWTSSGVEDVGWDFSISSCLDSAYQQHKDILVELRNLLRQNQGCHMDIETYENLLETGQPVSDTIGGILYINYLNKTIDQQATELKGLPDRVLFVNYTRWPNNILDQYCPEANAWSAATTGNKTDFWALFSVERDDITNINYCPSPNNYGDSLEWLLGYWFDSTSGPSQWVYPNAFPAFPYEVDELEDEYLDSLNSWRNKSKTSGDPSECRCCVNTGDYTAYNYNPKGFMWFFLELLQDQNIQKKASVGISLEYFENENVNVYPNPAKHILNIPPSSQVSLFNNIGQLQQVNNINSNTLDVSSLTSGIYFLKIKLLNSEKPVSIKVVIE